MKHRGPQSNNQRLRKCHHQRYILYTIPSLNMSSFSPLMISHAAAASPLPNSSSLLSPSLSASSIAVNSYCSKSRKVVEFSRASRVRNNASL